MIYPWEKEPAIEIKKDTYPSKCQTLILSKDANEAEKNGYARITPKGSRI